MNTTNTQAALNRVRALTSTLAAHLIARHHALQAALPAIVGPLTAEFFRQSAMFKPTGKPRSLYPWSCHVSG